VSATIDSLNRIFWNYLLIYGPLAVGLFFTWRLGFQPFLHPGRFFGAILHTPSAESRARDMEWV
jgi:AGCS family alanine or glycine:cation symporter